MRAYVLLIIGIIAASTSGPFIQMSAWADVAPFLLAFARLMLAGLLMMVFRFFFTNKNVGGARRTFSYDDFRAALPAGLLLGVHLGTWNMGVGASTVANATLIVNLNPVAMPIAMYLVIRERLTVGEILGTVVALGGVMLLMLGDPNISFSAGTLKGDLICFGSMLLAVAYLIVGKFRLKDRSLIDYLVPLYLIGALTCVPIALFESIKLDGVYRSDVISFVGLALVPTIIGHSIFNYVMPRVRTQVFSILNLSQFILAAILAWMLTGEVPERRFYPAAALIVVGAIFVVLTAPKRIEKEIQLASSDTT